jgi:hypothetical protein
LLKKGGKLVIHTSPNKYFSKYVYRIVYVLLKVVGKNHVAENLKSNIDATKIYHVFEFFPKDLSQLMEKSRFRKYHVWVNPDALRLSSKNYLTPLKNNIFFRLSSVIVNKTFLLQILGNDLFAIASK